MNNENKDLQQLVNWLSTQIDHANEVISEAHRSSNIGREVQYEGMRDAYMRCLNMITH